MSSRCIRREGCDRSKCIRDECGYHPQCQPGAPRYHFPSQLLSIHKLNVTSDQLGGLDASAAKLTGIMTPLTNTMQTFTLGELGPRARVEVIGSVGVDDSLERSISVPRAWFRFREG